MDNIELTQPDVRYLEPPLLLRNAPPLFLDVSKRSGPVFSLPLAARGAAFGYLHNNGVLDVALNCNEQPAVLMEWSGNANHWLLVDTIGSRSNRAGIGAQIRIVTSDGKRQYALVSGAGSYLSASDKRVHFGLGSNTIVKSLEIRWPSGIVQTLANVKADQLLVIRENAP